MDTSTQLTYHRLAEQLTRTSRVAFFALYTTHDNDMDAFSLTVPDAYLQAPYAGLEALSEAFKDPTIWSLTEGASGPFPGPITGAALRIPVTKTVTAPGEVKPLPAEGATVLLTNTPHGHATIHERNASGWVHSWNTHTPHLLRSSPDVAPTRIVEEHPQPLNGFHVALSQLAQTLSTDPRNRP